MRDALLRAAAEPLRLELKEPFRIAHGTTTERTNVFVRLGEGIGEAGLPPYLGTDFAEAGTWIEALGELDVSPQRLQHTLSSLPEGPAAARCALDLALHDHCARTLGVSVSALLGVDPSLAPRSFVTLSIPESLSDLDEAIAALPEGSRIKIKLGTGDVERDLAILQAVCLQTSEPVCADVNGGWSIPDAVQAIPRCAELGVEVLEQPIAPDDPDDWHLLRRLIGSTARPHLVADESVFSASDIIALAGAADAINIKLAKCGGLREGLTMVSLARTLDMGVMVGCMVESSIAIAAAACLAPLADYTDLDGSTMLRSDPFAGITFIDGRVVFEDAVLGLGVGAAN